MEALALLIGLGFLAFLVVVPVLLILALSRANQAHRRVDRLDRRLVDLESQLDVLRDRLGRVVGSPTAPAEAATVEAKTEATGVRDEAAARPSTAEVARPVAGVPASEVVHEAPEQALDHLPEPVEGVEAVERELAVAAEAEHPETLPQTLARLRQQRAGQPADGASRAAGLEEARPVKASGVNTIGHAKPGLAGPTQRRGMSFEELLAGKVFVWIGAVALVLTGAFLLKYGFDHNIIDERVRVLGAGAFGLAMLGVGEFLRKKYTGIAQALCGAAVADLFGTVLAAHQLYGMIGSTTAFVMTALITALAVVLSLRHGPLVALLGIVGGFTLPPLLGQAYDAQPGMIVYLIALEVGILAVTRKRGWMGISALTLVFSMAWSLGYTLIGDSQADRALTGLLVLATSVVFVLNTTWTHHREDRKQSNLQPLWLSLGAVAAGAALLGLLVSRGGYALSDLGMLGLMGAGTLVLARIDSRYRPLVWVTGGLSAVVLLAWSVRVHRGVDATGLATLMGVIAGFGGLYALGGYVAGWSGSMASRRVFSWLSAVAGPVFLALATFAGSEVMGWRGQWWYWTAGVAGLYGLGTAMLLRRGRAGDRLAGELFAAVAGLLGFVAIGQAADHPWPAVGWALLAAGLAGLGMRLRMATLLHGALLLSVVSAVVLVLPGPFDVQARGMVVFNTYLPMYALPAIGFAVVGWVGARAGMVQLMHVGRLLSVGSGGVLAVVLVRQGFHPATFNEGYVGLYERGTYGPVVLGYAGVMLAYARQRGSLFAREAGRGIALVGLVIALACTVLTGNPLLDRAIDAGRPLVFALGYLYLLPMAGLWALAAYTDRSGQRTIERALRVGAVVLLACFAALQVRNGFHFTELHVFNVTLYEWATYGLVWMVLGGGLAILSRYLPSHPLLRNTGLVVGLCGVGVSLLGTLLIDNPLWVANNVGSTPVFNGLWYVYLPTILALAALAHALRRHGQWGWAQLVGFTAVGLIFTLVCLLVRQGFSVDGLLVVEGRPGSREWYAYSLAWVVLGIALLVGGILSGLNTLRYGSLAVMLLAVGKVFALDTAQLADLYRVFSFLGLGVTLILLGYVYQRWVFGKGGRIAPRTDTQPEATGT